MRSSRPPLAGPGRLIEPDVTTTGLDVNYSLGVPKWAPQSLVVQPAQMRRHASGRIGAILVSGESHEKGAAVPDADRRAVERERDDARRLQPGDCRLAQP